MDAVFAVASGMLQTYMILNSDPPMTAEEENLALANAWVTSLPIVGDFADGIIGGIEAGFSGDRRKALESGLYIAIGVMGVVPGRPDPGDGHRSADGDRALIAEGARRATPKA